MKKILFIALATGALFISTEAMAADECKIMAYSLDMPVKGGLIPILGNHIETGVIDQGNSESYTIPEGAQMIRIITSADVWVNISKDGTNAAVDTDEFMPAGIPIDRGSTDSPLTGQIVKCISDS